MSKSAIWWVLAASAIAVELMTGTVYLLMLAAGLAGGAIAAYLELAAVSQMLVAAAIGGGAVAAWHWHRSKGPHPLSSSANPDVHLDVGESVHVVRWNTAGTASVHFRGALYMGTLAPGLNFLIPFVDRVAYKHSLKEIPLDVSSEVCITRDNTHLQVELAVQLKVAEKAVEAYSQVAKYAKTMLIVPRNMTGVSALITSAMKMVQSRQA